MGIAIETVTALLTLAGIAYMLLALWGARDYVGAVRRSRSAEGFARGVSLLKPLKGIDPRMFAGLESHCRQDYPAPFELVFGVHRLDDPAVAEVERLRTAYPEVQIKLVECSERLGTSGKVSNLVQMLPHASYEYVVINDSDIFVAPHYLSGVIGYFRDPKVGMVTAPYIGRTGAGGREQTIWSKLEALGISTDFVPGVLTARKIEGGIRFGMGSTLAFTKTALAKAGGLEPLVEFLADDYELGKRISKAGYAVRLCGETVETTVPAYGLRGFWDHQMRWARSTRDSRKLGYIGLGSYVRRAVGVDDRGGQRRRALELHAPGAGSSGPRHGGADDWRGRAAGRPGAARSLAAAAARSLWAAVLGVELRRGYGGVAWGRVSAEGWADLQGVSGAKKQRRERRVG